MTKIIYDENNKKGVINNLNTCINNINKINKILYNVSIPKDFCYINSLRSVKSNLIKCEDNLLDYKNNINKYMENINKNELELSSRINRIDEFVVQKMD